jgi:hypothetical protein
MSRMTLRVRHFCVASKANTAEGEFHLDLHTLSDKLLLDMMKFTDEALSSGRYK